MDATILDNDRLNFDNPRYAEAVGKMTRLLGQNPAYYNEWKAIAASAADKAFRRKISAASDAAMNKFRESKLQLDKTTADMNFDLKSKELAAGNDWKPQAILGGADILTKTYFGGKEAERKKAQAAKYDQMYERLFK